MNNKIKFFSYLLFFSILITTFSITSCNKQVEDIEQEVLIPEEPIFEVELPSFPSWISHVLQREFYYKKNQKATNLNYYEYIESRLIELYPEVAYEGMLEEAKVSIEQFKIDYQIYEEQLKKYYIANNLDITELEEDNYQEFTTLEDEIIYMDMTEDEIILFKELEKIATRKIPISRNEIENYTSKGGGGGILVVSFMSSAAVIAGYSVWRVIQSRNRAESKTSSFYSNVGPGRKADAFRHIYVSVLLRRYITRPGAHLVMNTYERINPNDTKNKYMDLHNNKVGRHTKYWTFRGSYIRDKYKWELWATRAKNWVNNSSNSLYYSNWRTASDATIISQENSASDYKYIYFQN